MKINKKQLFITCFLFICLSFLSIFMYSTRIDGIRLIIEIGVPIKFITIYINTLTTGYLLPNTAINPMAILMNIVIIYLILEIKLIKNVLNNYIQY
ncbi:MAG: hypothetical protein ACK5JH_01055 [Anaerocolumna sp.]